MENLCKMSVFMLRADIGQAPETDKLQIFICALTRYMYAWVTMAEPEGRTAGVAKLLSSQVEV